MNFATPTCVSFLFSTVSGSGTAGANVHADRALKVAVARVEVHPRLHHAEETEFEERRHEHARRAGAHAEPACRAGVGKMLDAPGAGRRDRTRYALGNRRRLALDDLLRLLGDAGESQKINS